MSAPAEPSIAPWAFWAPSQDEAIASALKLAGVGAGTRFLDLGCGDGRVLVAAAKLGAEVRGVEIDANTAEIARCNLAAADVRGEVQVEDMFTVSLNADVIYAYLTPTVLSRLRERLAVAPRGTRVVTSRYAIAGWDPSAVEKDCYLYETPVGDACIEAPPGWAWRATVVMLPSDRRVLVPFSFTASPGALNFELDAQLDRAAKHAIGSRGNGPLAQVPIDLTFNPHGEGSVVAGEIRAQGAEATVAVVFARNMRGQWNFGPDQGPQFRSRLDAAIASSRTNR